MQETDEDIIRRINGLDKSSPYYDYYLKEEILKLQPDKKVEYLDKIENETNYTEVLCTLPNDIINNMFNEGKIAIEKLKISEMINDSEYNGKQNGNKKAFLDNIVTILNFYEVDGDINKKSENLKEIIEINNEFCDYPKMKFRLLSDRFIDKLSIDKISFISNYYKELSKVLDFTDNELYVFTKSIDHFQEQAESPSDWMPIAKSIFDNIDEYSELINGVNIKEIDINKLDSVLQYKNFLHISNMRDFENAEEKLNEKLENDFKNGDLNERKNALIFKLFGFDLEYANYLINTFGEDAENLQESESKDLIKNIKNALSITDTNEQEKLFEKVKEAKFENKAIIDRKLKNEYFKTYLDGLFNFKDANEVASNVYEAGTNFRFIVTATSKKTFDEWNTKYHDEMSHFCASYISNDMLGLFKQNYFLYGFRTLDPSMLVGSKNMDIGSNMQGKFGINSIGENKYFTADNQINNTVNRELYDQTASGGETFYNVTGYSEMDISLKKEGKKTQPDYIIVFRENGKIINGKKALESQKSFSTIENPRGLPIIIIDKDECLISEKRKLVDLIRDYKENPNEEIEKKIFYNVRNNMQTDLNYMKEANINLEYLYKQGLMNTNPDYKKISSIVLSMEKEIQEDLDNRIEKWNTTEKEIIGEPLKKDIQEEENKEEENKEEENKEENEISQKDPFENLIFEADKNNQDKELITNTKNKIFLEGIINKGKEFVRTGRLNRIVEFIKSKFMSKESQNEQDKIEK